MAYKVTKNPDGDVNLGSLAGEIVTLKPDVADYPTGGYALIGGETAHNNAAPNTVNIDLWKILTALPIGGQLGLNLVWNPSTQKIQIFETTPAGSIAIPVETNAGTTGPVYADSVANAFTTTGAATSITNATFAGSAGPQTEVASGTDLSAYAFQLLLLGY